MVIATYTITPRREWTRRPLQATRPRYLLHFGYRGFRATLAVALMAGGAAAYTLLPAALRDDAGSEGRGQASGSPALKAQSGGEPVALADPLPPVSGETTGAPLPWLLALNTDGFSQIAARPGAPAELKRKTAGHDIPSNQGGSGRMDKRALGKPPRSPVPEPARTSSSRVGGGDALAGEDAAPGDTGFAATFREVADTAGTSARIVDTATPPMILPEPAPAGLESAAPTSPAPADSPPMVEQAGEGAIAAGVAPPAEAEPVPADGVADAASGTPTGPASPSTDYPAPRKTALSQETEREAAAPRGDVASHSRVEPDRDPVVLGMGETCGGACAVAKPPDPGAAAVPWTQSFPMVVVAGDEVGAVTLHDFAGGAQSVHLGTLLSLFKLKMHPAEFARLNGSPAAAEFVTFDQLRRAGLQVEYDTRSGVLRIDAR